MSEKVEKSPFKRVKQSIEELWDEFDSHFKLKEWDGKPFEHPQTDELKATKELLESPNYYEMIPSGEECTKDNSLYLTIDQQWFDKIASGEKVVEYREIKETVMGKYLDIRESPQEQIVLNPNLGEEFDFSLDSYNDGIFLFVPRYFEYLRLGVGYNKNRDTAVVRIKGICFMPERTYKGDIFRFDYMDESVTEEKYDAAAKKGMEAVQDLLYKADGPDTYWIMAIHLGEIVELNRGK